jgi:peptidoglycan/LPS O-acetylase OafA/YrhL
MDHIKTKSYGADILRGLAIISVVVYHAFGSAYGFFIPWNGWVRDFNRPPSQLILWFYPITFGWAGVALFFVISGFCIHFSFLRSKSFSFKNFFWRRFWRIYPTYIVSLITFTILGHINIFSSFGAMQFFSHALFLHNFMSSTYFLGINPSFWSIATEVQLYLLFPVLIFIRSRFGILGCLQITFIVGLLWRIVAVYVRGLPENPITSTFTFPLMTWFDWTLGAFVAEHFFNDNCAFNRKSIYLAFLLPFFVASTLFKPLTIFSFTLAAIVAAIFLDAALHISWRKSHVVTFLAFIGAISYSLYLWHQPLLYPIIHTIENFTGSAFLTLLGLSTLTIAGSWISFRIFEKVGIRIGDLLWKWICR